MQQVAVKGFIEQENNDLSKTILNNICNIKCKSLENTPFIIYYYAPEMQNFIIGNNSMKFRCCYNLNGFREKHVCL